MKRTEAESKAREGYDQMADVGCGPGHVTAYLAGLGLDIFVVDNFQYGLSANGARASVSYRMGPSSLGARCGSPLPTLINLPAVRCQNLRSDLHARVLTDPLSDNFRSWTASFRLALPANPGAMRRSRRGSSHNRSNAAIERRCSRSSRRLTVRST